uniref:Uncharacterized protein n=1 Tax=Lygus hesperus TaxID=30085 RepID=A0A0A9VQP4_LYGHE
MALAPLSPLRRSIREIAAYSTHRWCSRGGSMVTTIYLCPPPQQPHSLMQPIWTVPPHLHPPTHTPPCTGCCLYCAAPSSVAASCPQPHLGSGPGTATPHTDPPSHGQPPPTHYGLCCAGYGGGGGTVGPWGSSEDASTTASSHGFLC